MKDVYFEYINNICKIPRFLNKYLDVPCLKRLKKIGYFCGMDYASKDIYDFRESISRFDHSLSVALIVWKFTKDKRATLAGLFHDVGTPCFSHVIDYMNKDYSNQESTEEYTEDIIKNDKELLRCLKIDKINYKDISDFKKYSIVDNDRPKLCADRFDGVILTGYNWTKSLELDEIISITNDLCVYNVEDELELGFKSKNIALSVLKHSELIDKYCHSSEDNYMMELLAEISYLCIDRGIFTYKDLYYLDEDELFRRINNCGYLDILILVDKFYNIKEEDIGKTVINNVKIRDLNPLCELGRIKEVV